MIEKLLQERDELLDELALCKYDISRNYFLLLIARIERKLVKIYTK